MKKVMLLVLFAAFIFANFSYAQEMQDMGMEDPYQTQGGFEGQGGGQAQGMMGGPFGGAQGKRGGKAMMMSMMHKETVIATSDGGIVVMSGPRLIKYDSELNLVKETELPRGKKPGQPAARAASPSPEAEEDIFPEL